MMDSFLAFAALILAPIALVLRQILASFSAQRPQDYADGPKFDPRQHLNGPILCEGVIYGPMGRVSTRFVAKMHGTWDGKYGVLREEFTYDSGAIAQREWRLTLVQDGHLRAEADDVIGAGSGAMAGGALQLRYKLRLPPSAGGHVLSVNDWLYVTPNGTLINRSQMRKFGIKVAELVATMRPSSGTKAA